MTFQEYWDWYGCRRYAVTHEVRARLTWEDYQKVQSLAGLPIDCASLDGEHFEPEQKLLK